MILKSRDRPTMNLRILSFVRYGESDLLFPMKRLDFSLMRVTNVDDKQNEDMTDSN